MGQGTELGPYRLLDVLGRGGMGEVWRARDSRTDRDVALKVLGGWLDADPEFADRFRRECARAATVSSPHIVPVHNYGEIDGRLFIDMALIHGTSLRDLIDHGPLSPERAVAIIAGVGKALDAAHRTGLVHRDVKPSNILISNDDGDDHAYLIDFGIAQTVDDTRITRSGAMIGSPAYMPPERFTGDGDHRSDLYALGCVLYEALTGQPPFPGTNVLVLANAHQNTPPPRPTSKRPDLPAALDAVTTRALAKDPHQRFTTAGELIAAARSAITTAPSPPAEASGSATTSSQPRRTSAYTNVDSPPFDQPSDHRAADPSARAHDTDSPSATRATPSSDIRQRRRPILIGLAALLVMAAAVTALIALVTREPTTPTEPAAAGPIDTVLPAGPAAPQTADQIVASLAAKVPTVKIGVTYTADDDPNHLLGRPNGYTSKTTFTDSRIERGPALDATSVKAGGSVEVFPDADAAQRRQLYIQSIQKATPIVGTEYSYLTGTALVRVSGDLTPTQAAEYEAAVSGK